MESPTTPPSLTPPPNVPLFEDNGVMAKAWVYFFLQVFTTASMAFDLTVLEAFEGSPDSPDAQRLIDDALVAEAVGESGRHDSRISGLEILAQFDA